MGRGIIESGLFRSERYQLERRTSDPATTQEGEMWIRTDLAPDADQLATLRFDNGSGTWDIPIYDTTATTDNVSKALRFEVAGSTGFVPVTTSGGTYDALRLQHNDSTYAFHDALEASAIPDSVVDNFEAILYEDEGNTLSDYYSGDVSEYTRQTTTVFEGSYALECSVPGDGSTFIMRSYEGDGLNYPSEGDTFSYWIRCDASNAGAYSGDLLWGVDTDDSGFEVRLDRGSSNYTVESPNETVINDAPYSYPADEWEEWELEWLSDQINVTVYDTDGNEKETNSGSHTASRTSGGIGYRIGGGASITSQWDDVQIK